MSQSDDEVDLNNPPFPLTSIDRELLAMRDEDFHEITWSDLTSIIANNELEQLKRRPSDLRRYLEWSHNTKREYGSITNYVVKERLHWTPKHEDSTSVGPDSFTHISTTPFEDAADYAILQNDWPYGFAPGITHMLVWSRTPIAVDDRQGDVTAESRKLIEHFVHDTFIEKLAANDKISIAEAATRVLWFKNWVSLQSVRGVDHVHILVRDADANLWLSDG